MAVALTKPLLRSSHASYGTIDHEYGHKLATTDPADDGPVWMVNLCWRSPTTAMAPTADDPDAMPMTSTPRPVHSRRSAPIVYVAEVTPRRSATEHSGIRAAIGSTRLAARHRDAAALDFKDKHVHKEAGMEITFVIGCQPMEIDTSRLEKGSPWDDVEHPPDDEDGALHVLHVIK